MTFNQHFEQSQVIMLFLLQLSSQSHLVFKMSTFRHHTRLEADYAAH